MHKLLFFQYVCFIQFSMTHGKKGADFMLKNKVFGQAEGGLRPKIGAVEKGIQSCGDSSLCKSLNPIGLYPF